jgi:ArsR family transcriptional regulator
MDKDAEERIFQMHAEVCKSMANPTRLRIMSLLREGEKPVEELRNKLKLPKANLSQHLGILRQRGIVSTRRAGLNIHYKIANPKMIKACDILREVLFEQLQEGGQLMKVAIKKKDGSKK